LAERSPLRLSRCRPVVRPLLARWGATPQSLAKAASLQIRLALSPAVTRNWVRDLDADAVELNQVRGGGFDEGLDLAG
jgi:hypothetical protein